MFANASARRDARTAETLRIALEGWRSTMDSWYDGTPGSITARVAGCDRLIHRLRQAGIGYQGTIAEMQSQRAQLATLRNELLHGANQNRVASSQGEQRNAGEVDQINMVAARAFVRENIDVAHVPEEMRIRAHRHASLHEPRADAGAFATTCLRIAAAVPRPKTASAPPPISDFDDALMFL